MPPVVVPFNQPAPELGNQYDDDRVLRSLLARVLGPEVLADVAPELRALGELAGGALYARQREDRLNEPHLTNFSAWGERVDRIEVSPLWQEAERLAATHGLVATAYERRHGALSRVHQFALVYLFAPSTDVYSCPLAMTDGAARTLLAGGDEALIAHALPHLTSRDPAQFWTSGQWMTESTGGSDVGRSETIAEPQPDGSYRLYGRKWFTSAIASQMAVTLARPLGNGPGGSGLALFFVETHDEAGRPNRLLVHRLKDKLGTRKVPTAELTLDGTPARLVVPGVSTHGTRHIAPMLGVTRTWNAVCAVAGMRRAIALARDYARKRVAFGASLSEKPLHLDTLAGLVAEHEAATQLVFRVAALLGRDEAGTIDPEEARLLRVLTPVVKLVTGKQAVAVASEALEAFGGAGYVEDTGLPVLLRDAQVLSIWEGTTNVLSLDTLRALGRDGGLESVRDEVRRAGGAARDARLVAVAAHAEQAVAHASAWLGERFARGAAAEVEGGARRFAMTLGRALEAALLVEHAQWSLDHERDARAAAAAVRFARAGLDLVVEDDALVESAALADDRPLAVS
jgi:acyl-CoA dehydrogenase